MTAKKDSTKPEDKLISIYFVKSWSRYCRGDLAGFDKKTADALKDKGIAVDPKDEPKAESE